MTVLFFARVCVRILRRDAEDAAETIAQSAKRRRRARLGEAAETEIRRRLYAAKAGRYVLEQPQKRPQKHNIK